MQNIAKSARTVKQPRNRAMAFEAVIFIANSLTKEQRLELGLDLARLYAAFMPAIPKKPRTGFEWCTKAMAVNDKREQLNFVHVTEARIACTDGHRIHIAPNADGLKPGYYDKAGFKVHDIDADFPNGLLAFPPIERHIAKDLDGGGRELKKLTIAEMGQGSLKTKDNVSHYYKLPIKDDLFVHINMEYLNDAVSMEDAGHALDWSIGTPSDTVQIANLSGGRQVVLGPMRV